MPRAASDQRITSRDNPVARHLRSVARRREPGLVLLEGPRVVAEAERAGLPLQLIAVREGARPRVRADRVVTLATPLFNSLSSTETPQGVLAVAAFGYVPLAEARRRAQAAGVPAVVLDGVQDPGNVGTIARTAAAAGAAALVLLPGTADAFAPKAVRASAGNVLRLAVARATLAELAGWRLLGAAADAPRGLYETDLAAMDALVLGSEAHGLRGGDFPRVAIPLAAGVESLNVAAAAAVLLFELRRQRQP